MVDIAHTAFRSGNYELASDIYERLIKETGPACELYVRLGEALSLSGKLSEAFAAYSKAFRLGKVGPERLDCLATALVSVAKTGMASGGLILSEPGKMLKQFADSEPFGCACCLGMISEAVTVACGHSFCKKCLSKLPADSCVVCGRNSPAADGYKVNVLLHGIVGKLFPSQAEICLLKEDGNRLFNGGHHAAAADKYSEAIAKAPTDHILWSNRSNVHATLERYDLALADATEAVRLQPTWAKGHYRQGVALAGLGRTQEAALSYMKCLVLDSEASAAHSSLIKILHDMLEPTKSPDDPMTKSAPSARTSPVSALVTMDDQPASVEEIRFLLANVFGCMEGSSELPDGGSELPDGGSSGSVAAARRAAVLPMESQATEAGPQAPVAVPMTPDKDGSSFLLELEQHPVCSRSDGTGRPCPALADLQARSSEVMGRLSSDDFECSLCYRLLYEPVTTPCGHTFCHECLTRALDHSVDCPQCRGCLREYLAQRAQRRQATTVSIETILKTWFADAYAERKKVHEEDMAVFASRTTVGEIPIFVCTIGFPTMPCPLHIFEPRYRLMIRQCMETGTRQFGMCLYSPDTGYADIGTMLEIRDVQYFPDGRSVVDTMGGRRFRVVGRGVRDGYSTAKVEFLEDVRCSAEELPELQNLHDEVHRSVCNWVASLPAYMRVRLEQNFGMMPPLESAVDLQAHRHGPSWMWWVIAMLPIDANAQVAILGMTSLRDRLTAIQRVVNYVRQRRQQQQQ